jgi:hypothetical protein
MAWAKGTISLEAARSIFVGVDFTPLTIGEKVVGYRAIVNPDWTIEDASITKLCAKLWAGK